MQKTLLFIEDPHSTGTLLKGEYVTFNTEDIFMLGSIDSAREYIYEAGDYVVKCVFKRKIWFKGIETPYLFWAKNKSELLIEGWDAVNIEIEI